MLGALALCGLLLVGEPEPTVAPNVEVNQVAVQYDEQTEYEIDLLARLIYAESGSTWCSNKMQYYVGSVVLNRVASPYFPNTIEEVIYSPGQYTCIKNGVLCSKFDERTRHCAEYLITNGSSHILHTIEKITLSMLAVTERYILLRLMLLRLRILTTSV